MSETGFTKEEKFLNSLATKSFLKFWSWPNLFRDQGQNKGKGDGKEICDLTVIFGNTVIFFSDKKINFNREKSKEIAWSRWSRKAINDSVTQVKGARRWFLEFPSRIFLDKKCIFSIPIDIPVAENIKFYNVVVCHGIEDALSTVNSESSFSFDNSIIGEAHWNLENCKPFCLGRISEEMFIHVFNEKTIELVLSEFDTVRDFVSYLTQRELLFTCDKSIKVKSESDIVQLYYENYDADKKHFSILAASELRENYSDIDKGGIDHIYKNPIFQRKKKDDVISYFWDDLIESFSHHVLNGTSVFANWETINQIEPCLRIMAESSRFERRISAQSFNDFYSNVTEPGIRGSRLILSTNRKGRAYFFLAVPHNEKVMDFEKYRDIRRTYLPEYCAINKYLNPEITEIIGVAFKTRDHNQKLTPLFFDEGQDFLYFDSSNWTAEDNENAKESYELFLENGLINKPGEVIRHFDDFKKNPQKMQFSVHMKGNSRNSQCSCGSGKKYKECCGR